MEAYGLVHVANKGWFMTSDCRAHSTSVHVILKSSNTVPIVGVTDMYHDAVVVNKDTMLEAPLTQLYKEAFPLLWFFEHSHWETFANRKR